MSKNVNVLAVMDRAFCYAQNNCVYEDARELDKAREAVAELVEAIDGYLSARKSYNPLYANKQQYETFAKAEARFNAAISGVRGGE